MSARFDFAARMKKLRAALADAGVDALVVQDLVNVRWLCGFKGSYGTLVVDRAGAWFLTDGRYAEIATGMVAGAKILIQPLSDVDRWFAAFFKERGYGTLAFEGSLTLDEHDTLRKRTKPAKTKLVKDEAGMVRELRLVKDDAEIALLAKAEKLADRMMLAAWEIAKPGVSELEISKFIRRAAEDFGAQGESFANIVASGPNASRPHHSPSARRVKKGDMVTLDLGCIVEGYCSDLTRTPVVGKVSREFEKIYAACLEAQEASLKACVAGAACKDVDAIARDIIAARGYGEYFNHGLGHGVGLQIHEAPRLNKVSKYVLRPGMIVTVEPGIYVPGLGGVRIEDLVVITDGRPRVLSKSPKGLTVLPA